MPAEIFDVDVAAQTRVEQQIPAGVMVVVIDIDLIVIPLPIAAAVKIVRSHDPIGIVVQKDVPSAVIETARDKDFPHVVVAAIGIGAAGADAFMVGIPIAVMRIVRIVPTLVFSVVVIAAVIVTVFVPALMLAVVMTFVFIAAVVTILRRGGQRERACQCHENNSCKEFAHKPSLQNLRSAGILIYSIVLKSCRIGVPQDD